MSNDQPPNPQRAAFFGLLQSGTSLFLSIIRTKIISILFGPNKVGLGAEVQQISNLVSVPGSVMAGSGLLSLAAQKQKEPDALILLYQAALTTALFNILFTVLGSILLGALFLPLGFSIWNLLFWAGLGSAAGILAQIPAQFLIVFGAYSSLAYLGLFGSILGAGFSVGGAYWFGLSGQFAGSALATLLIIPLTIRATKKALPQVSFIWKMRFELSYFLQTLKIGLTVLIGSFAQQGSLTAVRLILEHHGGSSFNGQFQAAWLLGATYFSIIFAGLGNYVYPRYAAAKTNEELSREVEKALDFVLQTAPPLVLLAISFRELIVHSLFSHQFDQATSLVAYIMIGDIFRATSDVIAGPLVFRSKTREYLITCLISASCLIGLTAFFVGKFGLNGFGLAYIFLYLIYQFLISILMYKSCSIPIFWRKLFQSCLYTIFIIIVFYLSTHYTFIKWMILLPSMYWLYKSKLFDPILGRLRKIFYF